MNSYEEIVEQSEMIANSSNEERFEVLTNLLAQINRRNLKIKTEAMKKFKLKGSHVSCIFALYRNKKGLTNKELCEVCVEDKAAISRTLDYLEKNKYVVYNNKDRIYKAPITLTKKGKEVGEYVTNVINDALEKSCEGVSKEDLAIFYRGLITINENMKNIDIDI